MSDSFRRLTGASSYIASKGGGTAAVLPPPTGIVGSAITTSYSGVKTETGNVLEGRISLVALNTIILSLVVFYIWTRGVQGGG